MLCPLCQNRRARRACPALGHEICPVCCGTKRQIEIQCPSDCVYLASSREHPAAVIVRRQRLDVGLVLRFSRDLNERQRRLFMFIAMFIVGYQSPHTTALLDVDVIEATRALAATFETSARGLIYEHRPESVPAERFANTLKAALGDALKTVTRSAESEVAVVLRGFETIAREAQSADAPNPRALVELLGRVIRPGEPHTPAQPEAPRLIVP